MPPFLAHLIGDYLLQTEWMASNKKTNLFACFVHVLVYLIPFLLTGLSWWQLVLIGVTHFAQDSSTFVLWWIKFWKRVPDDRVGSLPLVIDQVFHLVTIYIVVQLPTWL